MTKLELHKIAPTLSEISPKQVVFKVPENYFETIEDGVMAEIKLEPISNLKNQSFNTPNHYFDTIEDVVLTKLKAEALQQNKEFDTVDENYFNNLETTVLSKIKTPKVISLKSRIIKIATPIAIAASLLLIFILNYNTSENITFDSLATAEIEQIINNGWIDVNEENITTAYADVELTSDFFSTNITEDELLDYLNSENIDEILYEN